jgi:hypothetical protein
MDSSSDRLPKHLIAGFALALLLYGISFSCDQHIRQRKGPWQVTFGTNNVGSAQIEISQANLGIHTTIQIAGEMATNVGSVSFDRPEKTTPFGRVKFEDLTYLPGSVAFDFFGHEVELLPRTLYLNKREHPWRRDEVIELKPEEKLKPEMTYDPRRKKNRP